jgi:hypothetical protein
MRGPEEAGEALESNFDHLKLQMKLPKTFIWASFGGRIRVP